MSSPTRPAPRKLGERCRDADLRPGVGAREAVRLADDLAIVGHPVRMQLLTLLARAEGRVCVCDLETAVAVKQPTVSHHLRLLREAGLVEVEREGLWAFYYLDREALAGLRGRIMRGLDSVIG